jgi:CRP-like cAMP-binding protein
MIPLDYVRPIPFFQGLDDLTLQKIAHSMIAKSVRKLDLVVQQGDVSSDLIFLLRGQLQVIDTTADGKEVGIAIVKEGDFLGELSVIDGKPRSASVVALVPSVVAILPRPMAIEYFFHHPVGSERIIRHLAGKLRGSSARHTQVVSGKAQERVLHVLKSLGEPQPDGSFKIAQLPTQNQMAVMANLARETVARTLAQLKKNGVLADTSQGPRQLVIRLRRPPTNLKPRIESPDPSVKDLDQP